MNENKNVLGDTFINGRMINLDSANIEDLERYLKELEQSKDIAMNNFNKIIEIGRESCRERVCLYV